MAKNESMKVKAGIEPPTDENDETMITQDDYPSKYRPDEHQFTTKQALKEP